MLQGQNKPGMSNWTAIALSDDLPPAVVVPFVHGGGEYALWRSASGRISAFPDRCPHRGMRLSHGFVRGERLNCIYHGWAFDGGGQCRRIPAHPDLVPPEVIRVPVLSVEEVDGVIWVSDRSDGQRPGLGGMVPLRQIEVAVPRDRLPDQAPDGIARLLSAPAGTDATTVIALVVADASPARRLAASAALEAWRYEVEHD